MKYLFLLYIFLVISLSSDSFNASDKWGHFLDNMTGCVEDQKILVELFETKAVSPSDALLGILRSEKSSNGLFDCSSLIDICNNHKAFITHATKMEIWSASLNTGFPTETAK
jgi:hypothetical protein